MLSHVPGLQTYNSKQPFSLVNGVAVQIYRQASKPVSYTHLDVYKRQEQDYHTADIVHADGKALLAGEESLHVFNESHTIDSADRVNAENRVDILRFEQSPELVPCIRCV